MLRALALFISVPMFLLSFCLCLVGRDGEAGFGMLLAIGGGALVAWAFGAFNPPAVVSKPYESGYSPGSYPQAPPAPSKILTDSPPAPASPAPVAPDDKAKPPPPAAA